MKAGKWSDSEYEIAVQTYCEMWAKQQEGKPINVSDYARLCVARLNESRDIGSIKMRFSNINSVFKAHGLPPVSDATLGHITNEKHDFIWRLANENLPNLAHLTSDAS